MRVEQQNANIVDAMKQSIGPEEREGAVALASDRYTMDGVRFDNAKTEKSSDRGTVKSVNLKDATYLKPENETAKTAAEDYAKMADMDAAGRKEQMVVLANTTSPEDYAKMQEEGFALDETTSNTIVTETDKIKAQLAKAGVDISFFGDDLDMAQLEAIAGSPELARVLAQAFEQADIPCTEENMKDAAEALKLAGALERPSDGAIKYILEHELAPTIENLYKAEYSGSANAASSKTLDMTPFRAQVERIIRQSGLPVNDQTMASSQWLLENEVPLNEENLKYLQALKQMELPAAEEKIMEQMATAVAEGGRPQDAMLLAGYTMKEKAEETFRVISQATDADLTYIVKNGMDVTVQSISYAMEARGQDASEDAGQDTAAASAGTAAASAGTAAAGTGMTETASAGTAAGTEMTAAASAGAAGSALTDGYTREGLALITARRQLEEARLAMSAEANYSLLRRGINIDTLSLEKLVEALKATENAYYENLLRAQGAAVSEENAALFRETTEKVSDLKTVPAYVLGMQGVKTASMDAVHEAGKNMQGAFERANERYETLMTAPRADLGDSIQKAFRNVDDILQDLGLELSEENRRAVRILGYNQIEITPEAVAEMKAADEEVQRTFRNMTPATVTEMIKRGINPLDMDFATLNQTAEQIHGESETRDNRRFGEFLWKLEQNHAITEEERSSYIGTYRLIHQVEQSDGAVIGALLNQGAEITMRNLMMAVRSERHSGKMDYSVDESFAAPENRGYMGTSIVDQMEAAYQNNCLKDVADELTPGKMQAVMQQTPDWESMTPEQLKAALAQADAGEAQTDYAYAKEQLAQLAESAKVAEDIYAVLQKYDMPNTMSNVMAMEAMVKNRNGMFRQIFGKQTKAAGAVADAGERIGSEHDGAAGELTAARMQVLDAFAEAADPEALTRAQEELETLAEDVMRTLTESDAVTSLDIREMRLLSAQLEMGSVLAREEQYSVPVMVSDGVINVSLKIVRGEGKKGVVDVVMESEEHGRIAATFQAKEQGVSGLIATDHAETKVLLEGQEAELSEQLAGTGTAELHYAHISDLDLRQFSMGMRGAEAQTENAGDTENYQVQTTRLYHIAERFIQQIRELL